MCLYIKSVARSIFVFVPNSPGKYMVTPRVDGMIYDKRVEPIHFCIARPSNARLIHCTNRLINICGTAIVMTVTMEYQS